MDNCLEMMPRTLEIHRSQSIPLTVITNLFVDSLLNYVRKRNTRGEEAMR